MTEPATGRRIGFVGLGNLGGRMTWRLVGAGIPVVGHDLRAGQAEAAGAAAAETPGEVCEGTEVVLLSLPGSKAVEAAVPAVLDVVNSYLTAPHDRQGTEGEA